MKKIAVIPARWGSSRFKGKILAEINGKPMIQHIWEKVRQASSLDGVYIAVDKRKVYKVAKAFGAEPILTSDEHTSGTDRIAEAVRDIDADIIINVQGDEPMIRAEMIDDLAGIYDYESEVRMATLVRRIESIRELEDKNIVKAVIDRKGYALYFSRSAIPYVRDGVKESASEPGRIESQGGFFKHIGLYSYTKDFLYVFANLPKSTLEEEEKLEQLRVLEHGYKIKTIETRFDTISVDVPEDIEKVKEFL